MTAKLPETAREIAMTNRDQLARLVSLLATDKLKDARILAIERDLEAAMRVISKLTRDNVRLRQENRANGFLRGFTPSKLEPKR